VTVSFLVTDFTLPVGLAADELGPVAAQKTPTVLSDDLAAVAIPSSIGKIQEFWQGTSGDTVVLVQDAHAIPAAQRSIKALIEHFQKTYGLSFVGLEGAASELDPLIFRSFPDREILRKTFDEYFDRGELTGPVAAAVLGNEALEFQGIEDWDTYEQGLALYLAAAKKQPEIAAQLLALGKDLEARKDMIFSPELREIDRLLAAFNNNSKGLLEVLKKLAAVKPPEPGTELAILLEESSRLGREQPSLEMEVKSVSREVEKQLTDPSDVKAYQQKFQEFQTSGITPQEFMLFLKELAAGRGWPVRISEGLAEAVGKQKKMRDIQGTHFFTDFEVYASSVKAALFRTDDERKLDERSRLLGLLGRFTKLELNQEDWREIKDTSDSIFSPFMPGPELPALFFYHFAFYRNAEQRDEAFIRNLFEGMRTRGEHSALAVSGGFHTEGLVRLLKERKISYVLAMPAISEIPGQTTYTEQMRGNVSWKDYFEVENGKVNLYKAFVRALRDNLIAHSPERSVLLKEWRDQILRDLAASGKTVDAERYASFLDEISVRANHDSLQRRLTDAYAKIDRFIDGLMRLESEGNLDPQHVMQLVRPATIGAGVSNGSNLAPGAMASVEVRLPDDTIVRMFPEVIGEDADAQSATARGEIRTVESGVRVPQEIFDPLTAFGEPSVRVPSSRELSRVMMSAYALAQPEIDVDQSQLMARGSSVLPKGLLLIYPTATPMSEDILFEILDRALRSGYAPTDIRIYSGEAIRAQDILKRHYSKIWSAANDGFGALAADAQEAIRTLYRGILPASFGVVYDDKLVFPVSVLEDWGLNEAEIERMAVEAERNYGAPEGLQKINSDVFSVAVKLPDSGKVPGSLRGKPVILLNVFYPRLKNDFENPSAKTIAVVLQAIPGVAPVAWHSMLSRYRGGSDPKTAAEGSLRRDAYDRVIPVTFPVDVHNSFVHLNDVGDFEQESSVWFRSEQRSEGLSEQEYYAAYQAAPPTLSYGEFLALQEQYRARALHMKSSVVARDRIAVPSTPVVRREDVSEQAKEAGDNSVRRGEVELWILAAGTGGRAFGYKIPESQRIRGLIPIARLAGGLRSGFEIAAAHARWLGRTVAGDPGRIPVRYCTSRLSDAAIRRALQRYSHPNLLTSVTGDIPRLQPYREDLQAEPKVPPHQIDRILENNGGAPGQVFRFQDGSMSRKPLGALAAFDAAFLDGSLWESYRKGVRYLWVGNDSDLGMSLDTALLGRLIESGKEMLSVMVEKDTYYKMQINGEDSWVQVRNGQVFRHHLPEGFGAGYRLDSGLEITKEGIPFTLPSGQIQVVLEKGGVRVNLEGKTVILEPSELPKDFPQDQLHEFNSNQTILSLEALFAAYQTDPREYPNLSYAEKEKRLATFHQQIRPPFMEVKEIPDPSEKTGRMKFGIQMTHPVCRLAGVLRTEYVAVDRDARSTPSGYGSVKDLNAQDYQQVFERAFGGKLDFEDPQTGQIQEDVQIPPDALQNPDKMKRSIEGMTGGTQSEADSYRELAGIQTTTDRETMLQVLKRGNKLELSRLALNPAAADHPDILEALYAAEDMVSELGPRTVWWTSEGGRSRISHFDLLKPEIAPYLQVAEHLQYEGRIFERDGSLSDGFLEAVRTRIAGASVGEKFIEYWVDKDGVEGRMMDDGTYRVGITRKVLFLEGQELSWERVRTLLGIPSDQVSEDAVSEERFIRNQTVGGKVILPAQVTPQKPSSALYRSGFSTGQDAFSVHAALASNPAIPEDLALRLAASAIPPVLLNLARFNPRKSVQEALLKKELAEVIPMLTDNTMTPARVLEMIRIFLALNPRLDSALAGPIWQTPPTRERDGGEDWAAVIQAAQSWATGQAAIRPGPTPDEVEMMAVLGLTNANARMMRLMAQYGFDAGRVTMAYNTPITFAHLAVHWAARNPRSRTFFDLSGGKIRTGTVDAAVMGANPKLFIPGTEFILTERNVPGDLKQIHVPQILKWAQIGDRITLDDENLTLRVKEINAARQDVICEIMQVKDALYYDKCGVAFPDKYIPFPGITPDEFLVLEEMARLGVLPDEVGVSFASSAEDIHTIRAFLRALLPEKQPAVLAKIETIDGLKNLDEIVSASDRIMIARGDLSPAVQSLPYFRAFDRLKERKMSEAELREWYRGQRARYGHDFTWVVGSEDEFLRIMGDFYDRFFGLEIFNDLSLLLHYESVRISRTGAKYEKPVILATNLFKGSRKRDHLLESEKAYVKAWAETYGRQFMFSNEFSVGRQGHHLAPEISSLILGAKAGVKPGDVAGLGEARPETRALDEGTAKFLDEIIQEMRMIYQTVHSWPEAVDIFGSARIPESHPYYTAIEDVGEQVALAMLSLRTGASFGAMEAGSRGYQRGLEKKLAELIGLFTGRPFELSGAIALSSDVPSGLEILRAVRAVIRGFIPEARNAAQGIQIQIPHEVTRSPYVDDDWNQQFRHFAARVRALHENAKGMVIAPGGLGTLHELFEVWRRNRQFVLYLHEFWDDILATFYQSWAQEGITERVITRRRQDFLTTDSPQEAVARAAQGKAFKTTPEQMEAFLGVLQGQFKRLYEQPPAIAFVGRPNPKNKAFRTAQALAAALAQERYPVRVTTRRQLFDGILDRMTEAGALDLLSAVFFMDPKVSRPSTNAEKLLGDRLMTVEDATAQQILTTVNTLGEIFLPGGVGTMNRLFESLTRLQIQKDTLMKEAAALGVPFNQAQLRPLILVGRDFYEPIMRVIKAKMLDRADGLKFISATDLEISDGQAGLYLIIDGPEDIPKAMTLIRAHVQFLEGSSRREMRSTEPTPAPTPAAAAPAPAEPAPAPAVEEPARAMFEPWVADMIDLLNKNAVAMKELGEKPLQRKGRPSSEVQKEAFRKAGQTLTEAVEFIRKTWKNGSATQVVIRAVGPDSPQIGMIFKQHLLILPLPVLQAVEGEGKKEFKIAKDLTKNATTILLGLVLALMRYDKELAAAGPEGKIDGKRQATLQREGQQEAKAIAELSSELKQRRQRKTNEAGQAVEEIVRVSIPWLLGLSYEFANMDLVVASLSEGAAETVAEAKRQGAEQAAAALKTEGQKRKDAEISPSRRHWLADMHHVVKENGGNPYKIREKLLERYSQFKYELMRTAKSKTMVEAGADEPMVVLLADIINVYAATFILYANQRRDASQAMALIDKKGEQNILFVAELVVEALIRAVESQAASGEEGDLIALTQEISRAAAKLPDKRILQAVRSPLFGVMITQKINPKLIDAAKARRNLGFALGDATSPLGYALRESLQEVVLSAAYQRQQPLAIPGPTQGPSPFVTKVSAVPLLLGPTVKGEVQPAGAPSEKTAAKPAGEGVLFEEAAFDSETYRPPVSRDDGYESNVETLVNDMSGAVSGSEILEQVMARIPTAWVENFAKAVERSELDKIIRMMTDLYFLKTKTAGNLARTWRQFGDKKVGSKEKEFNTRRLTDLLAPVKARFFIKDADTLRYVIFMALMLYGLLGRVEAGQQMGVREEISRVLEQILGEEDPRYRVIHGLFRVVGGKMAEIEEKKIKAMKRPEAPKPATEKKKEKGAAAPAADDDVIALQPLDEGPVRRPRGAREVKLFDGLDFPTRIDSRDHYFDDFLVRLDVLGDEFQAMIEPEKDTPFETIRQAFSILLIGRAEDDRQYSLSGRAYRWIQIAGHPDSTGVQGSEEIAKAIKALTDMLAKDEDRRATYDVSVIREKMPTMVRVAREILAKREAVRMEQEKVEKEAAARGRDAAEAAQRAAVEALPKIAATLEQLLGQKGKLVDPNDIIVSPSPDRPLPVPAVDSKPLPMPEMTPDAANPNVFVVAPPVMPEERQEMPPRTESRREVRKTERLIGTNPQIRAEMRSLEPRTVAGLAKRVILGAGLSEEQGRGVVLLVKVAGSNELRRAMRSAAKQTILENQDTIVEDANPLQPEDFNWGVEQVLETLAQYKEKGGVIGIVLPEALTGSFIKNFLKALHAANLDQVAVLGNLPGETVQEAKAMTRLTSLRDFTRKRAGQAPVPTGVFQDHFDMEKISEFLGFQIDMEGKNDPLARDLAEAIQLGAIIHAAKILKDQPPDLPVDAVALKQQVIQQLAIFDKAIVFEGKHFVIKAVVARLIAQQRAEARIQQAA